MVGVKFTPQQTHAALPILSWLFLVSVGNASVCSSPAQTSFRAQPAA
jgi:hypothetical protein